MASADGPIPSEPDERAGGSLLAGSGMTGLSSGLGSENPSGLPSSGLGSGAFPHHSHLPTPTLHDDQPSRPSDGAGESSAAARHRPRARFSPHELAQVCSRYDIGVIESVREFRRGSGRAPKVIIQTERGRFLLKRRTARRDTPTRVAFSHALQLHLAQRRFPLPRLIGTRTDHSTMLIVEGHVYELFEFIPGDPYDASLDAAADAGRALGLFHVLLHSFHSAHLTPGGSTFHNSSGLFPQMDLIASRLSSTEEREVVERLRSRYAEAARRVEDQGFAAWPRQIVHADWHPGNMLFHGNRVAAVIDYDTVRRAPRAIDIANGALQFSITMQGRNPGEWPDSLDEGRFKRFCRGYETVKNCVVSLAELAALPWLMVEALIVEGAVPIAATGSFAGLSGAGFLRMVDAKTRWIHDHASRLTTLVSE
jgi:Ser/Thr protein kinase RdoA (MazF antagonist)